MAAFGEVVNYATAETCRRRALLKHFGETLPAAQCTGCDYCEQPDTVAAQVRDLRGLGDNVGIRSVPMPIILRMDLSRDQLHVGQYLWKTGNRVCW